VVNDSTLGLRGLQDLFTGLDACVIIHDLGTNTRMHLNRGQCLKALSPCSTFKIPNALIGLETGELRDERTIYAWDGQPKAFSSWEHDHTLRSAIRDSVVWYFQRLAREVGEARMKEYLERLGYGNRDISGGIDRFWLGNTLTISAEDQVTFLVGLYRGTLPFSTRSMAIVREILVLERVGPATLSGKTGTGIRDVARNSRGEAVSTGATTLGWFVGHVATVGREVVFAVNIEASENSNGQRAKDLTIQVLERLGLWPPKAHSPMEASVSTRHGLTILEVDDLRRTAAILRRGLR
jgi:beta-lactamase class D